MVLINTLTVEAINTALIALQKGQSIVIGGEKGTTVNNITVTNNGGSSGTDYAPLISAVSDRVGLLEKAQKVYEQIQTEQKIKIAALEKLGIQEVEYNDATRELSIRTKDGKSYSTTFPEPYVALDIEGSNLILTSGDMIASVTLPFILASEKGQPNGVATLDSMGRVPYSQLPESAMEFKGEWDASTNTPELEDGVGTNGDFYICSVGGTVTFGTGHTETFIPNDRVLYNGDTDEWIKLPAGQVQSVNGMTGDVVLSIPPAQIQSDWTQTDSTAKDFIKHKLPVWVTQGTPSDNMQPIDSVTDGEMRPVTSNAVYDQHYLTSADVVDQVTVGNVHSVTSNAVARAINPSSTTIIESTYKRTVAVSQGSSDWWSMASNPAPSVPTGKRLIRTFPRCSNTNVAVVLGSIYSTTQNLDIPAIITVADTTASIQVWLCIEVADL